MDFYKLVTQILTENMTSGGSNSVYGPNVNATATAFSGDNLAKGDARQVYGTYGGVLTRNGLIKSKKRKPKKKKKNN